MAAFSCASFAVQPKAPSVGRLQHLGRFALLHSTISSAAEQGEGIASTGALRAAIPSGRPWYVPPRGRAAWASTATCAWWMTPQGEARWLVTDGVRGRTKYASFAGEQGMRHRKQPRREGRHRVSATSGWRGAGRLDRRRREPHAHDRETLSLTLEERLDFAEDLALLRDNPARLTAATS